MCTYHLPWQANFVWLLSEISNVVDWGWLFQHLLSGNRMISEGEVEKGYFGMRSWIVCNIPDPSHNFSDLLHLNIESLWSCFPMASLLHHFFLKFYPRKPRGINANELYLSELTSYPLINFMLHLFFSNLDWKPLNQGGAVLNCLACTT